ncbi:MAG: acyltransferase, partial [Clostridiales Family XIII bacterium]|nr:acyltransferase [Clostridiales Family XIII bacterium]
MASIESAKAPANTDTHLWEGRHPERIGAPRLVYLDNLRSLVIFLVIVVHSASTYSGIAKWYYQEVSYDQMRFVDFAVYGTISSYAQAWFMGLMFFIAAYWAAKSLPRYGAAAFMKGRLLRLGVPLLFYDLVISPLIIIVIVADGIPRSFEAICYNYFFYIKTFDWANSAGPLWFAEALLIFCAIYTL